MHRLSWCDLWVLASVVFLLALTAGCEPERDTCGSNDRLKVELPPRDAEVGPSGVVSDLVLCGRLVGDGRVYTIPVREVSGSLIIEAAGARFYFPNLLRVAGVVGAYGVDLSFEALESAGDMRVNGSEADGETPSVLDAPRLSDVMWVDLRNVRFSAPLLASAGAISISRGGADLPGLVSAGDLSVSDAQLSDLVSLSTVDSLGFGGVDAQPAMKHLEEVGTLAIGTNPWPSVSLPALRRATELRLTDNPNLSRIDAPLLTQLEVLVARNNPALKECDIFALASQAGVTPNPVAINGNSNAPCQ